MNCGNFEHATGIILLICAKKGFWYKFDMEANNINVVFFHDNIYIYIYIHYNLWNSVICADSNRYFPLF